MKEYIITVATAAIIAALTDILAPKEWDKYIKVIIGFLILAVIIAPITKFKDAQILSPTSNFEVSDVPLKDKVSETLRQNVEKDIEERIQKEFGIESSVVVKISVDKDHKINGVEQIEIKTWKNPVGMVKRITEIYGCDKVVVKFE